MPLSYNFIDILHRSSTTASVVSRIEYDSRTNIDPSLVILSVLKVILTMPVSGLASKKMARPFLLKACIILLVACFAASFSVALLVAL